jgi:hypothetical protein
MDGESRDVTGWLPIIGRWSAQSDGSTVYDNLSQQADDYRLREGEQGHDRYGICLTGERLSDGVISCVVNFDTYTDGRILLGYRSLEAEYYLIGLGGYGDGCSLTHFSANTWRRLCGIGRPEDFERRKEHNLKVTIRGQKLSFEINGIQALEQILPTPIAFGNVGVFSWDHCKTTYSKFMVKHTKGDAFVVMQFDGFNDLYADVIRPVTLSFDLNPVRADEIFRTGVIMEDIIKKLITSQVVIAEVTAQNENVFYEVGYAHALNKPTILLADKSKKLPFDIAGHRCIFYENSINGKQKLEEALKNHLAAVTNE